MDTQSASQLLPLSRPILKWDKTYSNQYDGPKQMCAFWAGLTVLNVKAEFRSDTVTPFWVRHQDAFVSLDGQPQTPFLTTDPYEDSFATMVYLHRSCNYSAGAHEVKAGYKLATRNLFSKPLSINNFDNRWPGKTWNSTDLTALLPNCPPISITGSLRDQSGEQTIQQYPSLAPGASADFFALANGTQSHAYDASFSSLDPKHPISRYGSVVPVAPLPFDQYPYTYRGTDAFFHFLVTWQGMCSTSNSVNAQGLNTTSAGPSVQLFAPPVLQGQTSEDVKLRLSQEQPASVSTTINLRRR